MMKNSKVLLLALMLIGALALAACGGQAQEAVQEAAPTVAAAVEEAVATEEPMVEETAPEDAMGEGSIAVLLPDSASSARWEADDRRYFEQCFGDAGVEYSIVNAEGIAADQLTQAQQAITNGAKVILLVNLDSGSGAAIIAEAREAGVAIIDYDRLTIEGPGADAYISFDNVSVGRLMGETLEPVIDGLGVETPQIVMLNGSPTDNNATLFREGYFSVAEPRVTAGDWALVADQAVPDWDNQQALVMFDQILTAAGGEVDAVFAANDGLASSVISSLKSQGFDPVPLSGQDATVTGMQYILSGDQTMSVYKPIKQEADAACEAALALFNGEDVTSLTSDTINNGTNDIPFIKLTPTAVTRDNMADTVIADGFRTWEQICVGDFLQYCPEGSIDGAGGEAPMTAAVAGGAAAMGETASNLPADAPQLRIWADDTREPALKSVEAAFEEEYGVDLVIELVGFGDIRGLITTAGPAGEGPDIIVGAHDWLGELVSSGILAPIDLGEKTADFAPAAIQAFSYDGELYGLPNATENLAMFINTDLVPECPATWTEVYDISAELGAANTGDVDTDQYGFVRMEGDPFHFFPIQTAFGGYIFGRDADGNYDPTDVGVGSEGSIAAAEWLETMVAEGLQPPAVDWETMHAFFETGKSAMTLTGPWALTRIQDSGVPYEICPIPDETTNGVPFLGAQGFMVSAFSEDPLLAQIFLTEFVATPEVMQAFYDVDPRTPAFLPVLNALDDANVQAFGIAGEDALPMPAIPEMASVWEAWGNAVVLIHQGGDTAVNAFTNAQEQILTAIAGGG
jgi:maltose-binding protein MalE/ABC-type xylose transport system substrate-binding protein